MFKRANNSTVKNILVKPIMKPMINNSWLLILCQIMNVIPLILELSWWMLSILTLCIIWQILIVQKVTDQPNKILIGFLSVSGCILLAFFGKELGLLSTMIHLVVLSYILKAFEQRKTSDFYQIALLGLFVVTASLIFQQSLYYALAIAIIIIINFTLMASVFASSLPFLNTLTLSAKIFIQSIPVTIFLFIIFPKLSPLWEVPAAKSAKTGLSNSVKVGDIANLALSDELAFRVKFEGNTPSYSNMYWRAIVMEHFDGNSWETKFDRSTFKNEKFNETVTYETDGESLNYQVIISPTYQKWLFGLDVARINNSKTTGINVFHRQDYSLYSTKPITQNTSYSVTSYIQSPLALNITNYSYNKNLSFPEHSNPRLQKQAKLLRKQFDNDEKLITNVLSTFNKEKYHYTLNPPPLNNNSLDEFYFETKSGFCEHFASSFTFLMRAAGIPARLVTGYMGGEYNPEGRYYSIYQKEAHAWSEVWLQDKGWVRVDPTASINPERVERGFSERLLQEQSDFSTQGFSLHRFRNNAWLNEFRLKLEALDYNWTRWVIGYTADKQNKILQNIMNKISTLKNVKWISVFYFIGIMFIFMSVLFVIKKIKIINQPHNIELLYQQILLLLANKGVEKPAGMTAQSYIMVVGKKCPSIALTFAKFTQLYSLIEYQDLPDHVKSKHIKKSIETYHALKSDILKIKA